MLTLPKAVLLVLNRLHQQGYGAYLVGGCVRDTILGKTPQDWDIATAATPEQGLALFGSAAIPTGMKHGTITVVAEHRAIEVTTYRTDGEYSDHRHPQNVTFTADIKADLARRDFTVNAMAMDEKGVIIDVYGGRDDLNNGIIRCVGDGEKRFDEDALRIMRALRFSAQLGFKIEAKTAQSMRNKKPLLCAIAGERIQTELVKLLCGDFAQDVLRAYPDVLAEVIPEIAPDTGRNQWDAIWEHTVQAVGAVQPTKVLRLTMLLHGIGKCSDVEEEQGTCAVLNRLKFDNETKKSVQLLLKWYDRDILPEETSIRLCLRQIGAENFERLIEIKRAEYAAQASDALPKQQEITERIFKEILAKKLCFALKDLDINGHDLLELGYRGADIGQELNRLLEEVIQGHCANSHAELFAGALRHKPEVV